MRALFDSTGDGILIMDPQSRTVIAANAKAAALLGIPALPSGTRLSRLGIQARVYDQEGRELAIGDYPTRRSLRGEAYTGYRVTVKYADGSTREIESAGGTVEASTGLNAYVVLRDMTELRRLERVKDEIMQVMVHECRNPLQVLKGATLMLSLSLERGDDARARQFIESISRQVDAISSCLTDLTEALEATSSRYPMRNDPVDLGALFRRSAESFRAGEGHRHKVRISLPGKRLTVLGDESRLSVVLDNLLSNAAKYTPPAKRIWFSCRHESGYVTARVADEGTGIPVGDLERIFDGFYRSPDFAEWGLGGTFGLGLYISRSIARRHGGDLWAEHRDGGGTVMVLKLPLANGSVSRG